MPRRKKKPYANIDAVPRNLWNLPILCLRQGRTDKAEELLGPILAKIEDIKQFEVFLLVRKLSTKAGVYNDIPSISGGGSETNKVVSLSTYRTNVLHNTGTRSS